MGQVYIDLEKGQDLKERILAYQWEYRRNHPCKCVPRCFVANNFKDGIPEEHCKKMKKATTQKFRKEIEGLLDNAQRKRTLEVVDISGDKVEKE